MPVIPELAQCQGAASLWRQCVAPGSVYSVSAQSFTATLASLDSTRTAERADATAETGSTPAPSQCLSALRATSYVDEHTVIGKIHSHTMNDTILFPLDIKCD